MEDSLNKEKRDELNTPTSPASSFVDDGDQLHQTMTGQHDGSGLDKVSLARTKSIAEQLSLPHEIAFVSIVCMAQFFAR
jgi:hypothetical protein